MKLKSKAARIAALAFAFGATATVVQPSYAQPAENSNRTFFCGTYRGSYTTMVRNTRTGQNIPLVSWSSDYFIRAGFNPQNRCETVSNRFERQHKNGNLRFITSGFMGGQPVICTAATKGGSCVELLFTLRPTENPNEVVRNIFNIRTFGGVPPVHQSTYTTSETVEGEQRDYIDVFKFLTVQERVEE